MVTKRQEQLAKIRKEIGEILMKESNGDKEKAKGLLEKIAGKGRRTLKALDLDTASRVLEGLKREELPEQEKREEDYLPIPYGSATGPLAIASPDHVNKIAEIMKRIDDFAIAQVKKIKPGELVIFGDTVCLRGKAIDRFLAALVLPLDMTDVEELPTRHTPKDEFGNEYPVYRFQAKVTNKLTKMSLIIYSEESSGKGFYCKRKGGRKLPPSQVNLRDVRVAAHRGLRKEAVKCFFGLRGLTIEEAENIGINTKGAFHVPLGEK